MATLADRNRRVGMMAGLLVAAMVALGFASVPLYRIFCQVTGYGGTTQVATEAPREVLDRVVTVRFNADVAPGLAWTFEPAQRDMTVKIGEIGRASCRERVFVGV